MKKTLVCLTSFYVAFLASADVIVMKSGAKFIGTVTHISGGTIEFASDDVGTIKIKQDNVVSMVTDAAKPIEYADAREVTGIVSSWKNIKRIITPEDSKAAIADKGAKVICSSSGMLTAGRSVKWTQSILPNENDLIMFVGYAGEDTLAYKIKHEKEQKTININGKPIKNKAQIIDLLSFSSHMQRKDLINYYKGINCDKIYLVHSDKSKLEFKQDLENAINDCLKSTRVISVNSGTKINM